MDASDYVGGDKGEIDRWRADFWQRYFAGGEDFADAEGMIRSVDNLLSIRPDCADKLMFDVDRRTLTQQDESLTDAQYERRYKKHATHTDRVLAWKYCTTLPCLASELSKIRMPAHAAKDQQELYAQRTDQLIKQAFGSQYRPVEVRRNFAIPTLRTDQQRLYVMEIVDKEVAKHRDAYWQMTRQPLDEPEEFDPHDYSHERRSIYILRRAQRIAYQSLSLTARRRYDKAHNLEPAHRSLRERLGAISTKLFLKREHSGADQEEVSRHKRRRRLGYAAVGALIACGAVLGTQLGHMDGGRSPDAQLQSPVPHPTHTSSPKPTPDTPPPDTRHDKHLPNAITIQPGDGRYQLLEKLRLTPNDAHLHAINSPRARHILHDTGIGTYKVQGGYGLSDTGRIDGRHVAQLRRLLE